MASRAKAKILFLMPLDWFGPARGPAKLTAWPETGSVHDCAAAAVYPASDMSRFMTGAALHIDGGTWASHGWKVKSAGGFTL